MSIYNKIIDIQKLGQAWDRVRKNKPACGVDNVTYDMFEENRREELKQLNLELAEHRYESLPVRLSKIYKEEKVRIIAIFSMRDKVVQQSLAHELSRLYEPFFSKCTFAYRQGQSALAALDLIEEQVKSRDSLWVLKMDIADFFDHIRHEELVDIVRKRIPEADVLDLLSVILKAKILDETNGDLCEKRVGIYQGSSCAPVLSNIYLMDYDKEMEKRSNFYIRYSDDILVLEDSEEKAQELLKYTSLYLAGIGLHLKESKTLLHRLGEQSCFLYLGYQFTKKGRSVPAKAISSLTARLETMWFTSGLPIKDKLKKGQEILGGWEQYYRGEREPENMIEYVIVLSMVQKKEENVLDKIEQLRFQIDNDCRDIARYMAEYWIKRENLLFALREYEQFFRVHGDDRISLSGNNCVCLAEELLECYGKLLEHPTEELYTEIMQLYTDLGSYRSAAYFWEEKSKYIQNHSEDTYSEMAKLAVNAENMSETAEGKQAEIKKHQIISQIRIPEYMDLFVGREDIYAKELVMNGNQRGTEQILEPLTEDVISRHLSGEMILDTYVQRPNGTSKYIVFDVDISKKILLQHPYGSGEFAVYKEKAAEVSAHILDILRKMGLMGYLEDTGYRGYHVWVFFTEWIPVRYLNQFTDCVQKELRIIHEDIVLEIFPNSARIRQGKTGQKLKLPLGVHIRTGKRSFFFDEQKNITTDYNVFLSSVEKYSMTAIRKVLGMYALETDGIKKSDKKREADQNLDCFGEIPETVRIVLERCSLMRYLCQKSVTTGYLSHFERQSILYVFGHMGEDGKEFVNTVMEYTLNYQYNTTQKFIMKLPEKPISCTKLREQYKLITAEYGCSCNFKQTKNCYPSPVLHALKNSGEEQSEITVPISRTITKAKEEKVYEEINIHKQAEKLAQKIVELKKQRRGLDKAIQKSESELQKIFDNAGIDCLEIQMGLLVRKKRGEEYEWMIEL